LTKKVRSCRNQKQSLKIQTLGTNILFTIAPSYHRAKLEREKVDSALVVFGNVTEGEVQADGTDNNPQGVFCVPEKVALAKEKMEGFELVRSYNGLVRYAELLMMKMDTNNDGLILSNELPLASPLLRYAEYPETPISKDDSEASPRNDIALTTFDVESILIEYFKVADEDNDQVLNTFEF
jgi:hypothetical protein